MADLQLSLLAIRRELINPLIDGLVKPEGIDLNITCADPNTAFWRESHFQEFDITVTSISTLIAEMPKGLDVVGLPVFTQRRFMHTELHYHVDSGIEGPADLDGKRIGIGHYTMTTGSVIRGALQHDFGVPPERMEWHVLPDQGLNTRRPGFIAHQHVTPDGAAKPISYRPKVPGPRTGESGVRRRPRTGVPGGADRGVRGPRTGGSAKHYQQHDH